MGEFAPVGTEIGISGGVSGIDGGSMPGTQTFGAPGIGGVESAAFNEFAELAPIAQGFMGLQPGLTEGFSGGSAAPFMADSAATTLPTYGEVLAEARDVLSVTTHTEHIAVSDSPVTPLPISPSSVPANAELAADMAFAKQVTDVVAAAGLPEQLTQSVVEAKHDIVTEPFMQTEPPTQTDTAPIAEQLSISPDTTVEQTRDLPTTQIPQARRDEQTNAAREHRIFATADLLREENNIVDGAVVASAVAPQSPVIKSAPLKTELQPDGSWQDVVVELAGLGKLELGAFGRRVRAIVSNYTAILFGYHGPSATQQQVRRVLNVRSGWLQAIRTAATSMFSVR